MLPAPASVGRSGQHESVWRSSRSDFQDVHSHVDSVRNANESDEEVECDNTAICNDNSRWRRFTRTFDSDAAAAEIGKLEPSRATSAVFCKISGDQFCNCAISMQQELVCPPILPFSSYPLSAPYTTGTEYP